MAQNDDVIIVGSLSDKELRDSIDKLVDYVGNKTNDMAGKFTEGLDKMKLAMKDFAITQKVSVDVMKEAWRNMSSSFDAMVAAQSTATGSTHGSGKPQYPDNTVGHLEETIRLEEKRRKEMQLNSAELRNQNKLLEDQKTKLKEQTTSEQIKIQKLFAKDFGAANAMSTKTLQQAEDKLQRLVQIQSTFRKSGLIDEAKLNRLQSAIDNVRTKIERLKQTSPKSIQDVLGMDESSVDAVAKKMRELKRVQIDPNNAQQVKLLGDEYQRLSKLQTQLLGKNAQAIRSNNMLAQSFGYIRNRVVYALTFGAMTNFAKQVLEIRGQYELLERSLGVLVNSFEKGSQIFQELNEMAIKSPFTLVELGTAAKQLTAYNFLADEVVDTTRRLADISAALGISMERLTYNLGQIKAQGVLNARDARDFANAGLAIVPMLAQMYTEQKRFGDQVVTTAQVYDMMSKKLVSYSDVLQVLYKITDEGGKFFDFQAKQAETLKVQVNNLTLAMNNMYNEIGASNQGFLVGSVQTIKKVFENWKTVLSIVQSLIVTYGTYRTILALVNFEHQRTWGARIIVGITQYVNAVRSATGTMATFNAVMSSNVVVAFASALLGLASYFLFFRQSVNKASVDIERFGESGAKAINNIETLGRILKGIDENTALYKKTVGELNQVLQEYGVEEIKNRNEINSKIEKTIELVKEESAQRQRANMLARGQETFANDVRSANEELFERLKSSLATTGVRKELNKNVDIITSVIGDIVQENISLIANKTGDEYEKGMKEIFDIIEERMRRIGISGKTIEQQLSYKTQFNQTNFANIRQYINDIAKANQTLDDYNNKTEANYRAAKEATQSTMSFTEKVNANARAMRNNANDAVSLYNRIFEIVKLAQQNHVINFDLKLTAQKPPQWMQNIDLPELQRLAARFTAIAQAGGHAKGYTRETTYERGLLYASAAREKQYKEEQKALEERNKKEKKGGTNKDPLAESLKEEIELIGNIQKRYNEYRKIGVSTQEAIAKAAAEYNETLTRVNATLSKYGVQTKNANELANMDLRGVRDYYESLLDVAKGANNTKGIESLEKAIAKINVEIQKADYKKITDGLNNQLGKLKDEYELAVELDANPELGNMFADMFGITPDMLSEMPHTVGQLVDKYQDEIDKQLKGKFNTPFNILKTDINKWVKDTNVDPNSDLVKTLTSKQNDARGLVKKTYLDIQKMVDDYIKEYGDQQQQIEQIEKEKNNALSQLNSIYYTDALRQTKEYLNAKEAIENAARIKEAKATFAALKKTTDYDRFFNAIDTLTSKDALAIKAKIKQGIIQAFKDGGLTVSEFRKEIKALESQFDKLTESSSLWTNYLSGGFDKLIQKAKETGQEIETIGESISIKGTIDDKDKNFLQSMGNIFSDGNGGSMDFTSLMNKFGGNMKGLGEAVSQAGQGMQQGAGGFASTIAIIDMVIKNVHQTVQAIGSVIDELDSVRNEENKLSNAYWEGFKKSDSYAASGWENLKSGNIAGAVSDTANSLISLFNVLENAKNEKINAQIKESERNVKSLENSYKNLQRAIENAYGAQQIGARKAAIANKELQLVELQRQLALENSRSSKNRDVERITDLEGQIIDLKNELKDMRNDITNSFLGISSVSDAVNTMMNDIVDALRNGEDAMKSFDESIDNMIANMIKQVFSARILGPMIEKIWQNIDNELQSRGQGWEAWLLALQTELNNVMTNTGDKGYGYHFFKDKNGGWTYTDNKWRASALEASKDFQRITYEEWKAMMEGYINQAQKALEDATTPQMDDIRRYAGDLRGVSPELEGYIGELENILREMGLIKDATSEQALSKLQQGIQGLSEDTGSALESYMNGVSQQVYLHSDLLTQIRDAVVGMDMDVQLGVLSQMLLQLQNNYIVMQSMQSMMEGWTTPSGQGIRVELIS